MTFAPLDLMLKRVERYGSESDSGLFTELLYAGEFILKATTAAFVSAIEDDRENHRYRLLHALVRADGIGDWASALDEALTGAASQHLAASLSEARKALTERLGKNSWQHNAVSNLSEVLAAIQPNRPEIGEKVALRTWFQLFSELRNKTRGHGAITPATCAKVIRQLKVSISLVADNNPVFHLSWAYLHRNLSGKYKVVDLGGDPKPFAKLKSSSAVGGENLPSGIYIFSNQYELVELIHTDLDVSDFFFPNGAFRGLSFELHSLITDSRLNADSGPYIAPAAERPPSETEGKGELDIVGQVFSNLPAAATGYVRRPGLEDEARTSMMNDRHPIITLVGRGGIGKTSLALAVLHEVTESDRYQAIIWFSARDIDLLMVGAKPVQPRVLSDREIAEEYCELVGETFKGPIGKRDPTKIMAGHLRSSPLGATLFVFDNFETVRSPVDLFQWLDANIRLPNKVVITSRFREFKADFPIEVSGMEQDEAEKLVDQTALSLGIGALIGRKEREAIIEDSDGHPYVIKIVLGEIADAGRFSKPETLIARKEEILDALFERTYANLSPIAVRVFLTLSGWRSLVPQLAVEAVLLRHGYSDPEAGVDQLVRMSLVERTRAADGTDFLEVPLAAALFGRRKLEVNPSRTLIENDIRFLQDIGATTSSGLKLGIRPKVEMFFRRAARKIGEKKASLEEMRSVLEFLARGYPPAWLLLSELEQEANGWSGLKRAAEYARRYLEAQPSPEQAQLAWQRLVSLYRAEEDVVGGCSAFINAAELSQPPLYEVSTMANWLNNDSEVKADMDVSERGSLFKPLARLLELHINEASATDLSRLAWLHLHAGDEGRALQVAELGVEREPDNTYCQKLVTKLS